MSRCLRMWQLYYILAEIILFHLYRRCGCQTTRRDAVSKLTSLLPVPKLEIRRRVHGGLRWLAHHWAWFRITVFLLPSPKKLHTNLLPLLSYVVKGISQLIIAVFFTSVHAIEWTQSKGDFIFSKVRVSDGANGRWDSTNTNMKACTFSGTNDWGLKPGLRSGTARTKA
jgi:hypothetical protein